MMISKQITYEGTTYTVSASTLRGLDEACEYILESLAKDAKRTDSYCEELSDSFNQLLEDIDTGVVELPSRVDQPDQEVSIEPAAPKQQKPASKRKTK